MAAVNEESDLEDEEDIDFDEDDFEGTLLILSVSLKQILLVCKCCTFVSADDDEEDMLEHYLAEKSDSSAHSSRRAS